MFKKISSWVKTHKFHTFVIFVVVLYVLLKIPFGTRVYNTSTDLTEREEYYGNEGLDFYNANLSGSSQKSAPLAERSLSDVSFETGQESRKVITNSSFSLHVKNVDNAIENIRQKTVEMGGFMVNTNIRRDVEDSGAVVEVRIPSDQLNEFSNYLKTLAVKVVYENVVGKDITDQYVNYEERLRSLESTKARFEEIMEMAETVDEIMNVQSKILNIQNQIDSIKGQLDYMEKSVITSKVTINLSTDELSLPYAPVDSWKPELIARRAIRALISVFRGIGTFGIWVVAFLPLILLVLAFRVAIRYISENKRKKKESVKELK